MYPCSNTDGCDADDSEYETDFYLFDCSGNCIVGLDCVGECGGDSTNVEICTGCLDDGFQQWSPNSGSPACNYAQFAIIEGECLYNDCLGDCQEILDNDGNWIPNSYFTDTQFDGCGECGGDGSTCSDCNGVPNGTAYINPLCIGIDNNGDGCVGGDTGISDCLNIDFSFGGYMESNSTDTIKVFVTNLDTLKSLDIEFQYDSSILNITEFSLYGTALAAIGSDNYDYEIAYDTFVYSGIIIKVKFTMYFEPHNNLELFSPDGKENIFNIILEAMEVDGDITTQITIKELSVNEILMDDSNWVGGQIMVVVPTGCTDELACNYDPNAQDDDGSCSYEIDCFGVCGGDAVYDVCWVCGGDETDDNNCTCTEENIIVDCNGNCPPIEGCPPEEFSFIGGCSQIDECNVCVGGATERYPCEQDCEGEWGGIAYEDNCIQCIADINDIDCFNSSFSIFNSNGIEEDDFIIKELDTIYVALYMQNLPDSLEGIIIDLNYDQSNLSLINSKLNPGEFDTGITIPDLLDSSYVLYETSNNGTFLAAIVLETTNLTYQGNNGNILFLQFSNLGINGDSTVISYNKVQVNEHVMKEHNYTSQVIYFGDCYGVFNGQTPLDECGICGGDGDYNCDLCPGTYDNWEGIPTYYENGPTPADLYGGEGYNCEGELSINEILIPKSFELSQNYPNPFNPITYIQYSVPHFDFITIDIINISGQIIKTAVQSPHQPGSYEITWDGTNQNGVSVPSGIYFYKMDADEFISVKKLVLLK